MNKGYIPYGYKIENAKLIQEEDKIKLVQSIYKAYMEEDTTYQKIATILNEHSNGETVWTKSKVKYLLEDRRYLGYQEIPPIISKEDFLKVQAIKESRNKNKLSLPDIEAIKAKAICFQCREKMKRDTRTKHKSSWYCSKSECKPNIKMDDNFVKNEIMEIMNKTMEDSRILEIKQKSKLENNNSIEKLRSVLNREFEKKETDVKSIFQLLEDLVQAKYAAIDDEYNGYLTNGLIEKLSMTPKMKEFDIELFNEVVDEVAISSDGKIFVGFINKVALCKK